MKAPVTAWKHPPLVSFGFPLDALNLLQELLTIYFPLFFHFILTAVPRGSPVPPFIVVFNQIKRTHPLVFFPATADFRLSCHLPPLLILDLLTHSSSHFFKRTVRRQPHELTEKKTWTNLILVVEAERWPAIGLTFVFQTNWEGYPSLSSMSTSWHISMNWLRILTNCTDCEQTVPMICHN